MRTLVLNFFTFSAPRQGRRREGLEGFGKVLGRFGRVCKIWEGLGGFGRFRGFGGGVGTVPKDMGGFGKV